MRLALLATFGLLCTGFFTARLVAADEKPAAQTWTGVLIDDHCADKMAKKDNPQTAAAGHPKACCLKCASTDGVIGLMVDGKFHKLDDNGNKLAKDYLAKADATTAASVTGTLDAASGNIAATAVAAPAAAAPATK